MNLDNNLCNYYHTKRCKYFHKCFCMYFHKNNDTIHYIPIHTPSVSLLRLLQSQEHLPKQ